MDAGRLAKPCPITRKSLSRHAFSTSGRAALCSASFPKAEAATVDPSELAAKSAPMVNLLLCRPKPSVSPARLLCYRLGWQRPESQAGCTTDNGIGLTGLFRTSGGDAHPIFKTLASLSGHCRVTENATIPVIGEPDTP